ncbi:hypothetical protein MTO96_028189 [Rhipicephalus appendiculatus]
MPLYEKARAVRGRRVHPIYEEQVHLFFRANDTPEEKQRDMFLASCGTEVFSLLFDLLKPATPHTKTLSELLTALRSHFSPASPTLMERFHFNNRSRMGRGEPQPVGRCAIATLRYQLDSLLRDRFICGVNNPAMQTRLLEFPDRSLDDVVKTELGMDAVTKDAGEIARAASTRWWEGAVSAVAAVTAIPPRSASSHIRSVSRAEKLGTLHEYAERGNRTADHSSSLDQAQVPHEPAVMLVIASGGGDGRQQARVLPRSDQSCVR